MTGNAIQLTEKVDIERAVSLLSQRNPRFKERVEKGEINDTALFRIDPIEIKVLDFSNGIGPNAVQTIVV